MTKLIVQIPCFNEAETLARTVADIPRHLPGISAVEVLVVDDGSTDATAAVARAAGVDHVVRHRRNRGLAAGFMTGFEACLRLGADIIVNTDADNQYQARDLERLLEPILAGRADIVVGDRGVAKHQGFTPGKRRLQRLGSWVLGKAAGLDTPDAASGFRAFSRDAALRTLVLSEYSYTLETLIQAGAARTAVAFVEVGVNPPTRPSRLMRSTSQYVASSAATIVRAYAMYRPLRFFGAIGGAFVLLGLIPEIRYLYLMAIGDRVGHVQSLILGATLTIVGFQVILIGVLADLTSFNRKILEQVSYRLRRLEFDEAGAAGDRAPVEGARSGATTIDGTRA